MNVPANESHGVASNAATTSTTESRTHGWGSARYQRSPAVGSAEGEPASAGWTGRPTAEGRARRARAENGAAIVTAHSSSPKEILASLVMRYSSTYPRSNSDAPPAMESGQDSENPDKV